MKPAIHSIVLFVVTACLVLCTQVAQAKTAPNILFCISDDQSYAHTGVNGDPIVKTPAFDRIAREGIRFTHAFCDAPTCGPSRSAILTGQPIWRLEEAGNIHSTLPKKFVTYTETLEDAGYFVGFTGKGWSPGRLKPGGRTRNPAGAEFKGRKRKGATSHISSMDYAGNFGDFLAKRPKRKPFCFWLAGMRSMHRRTTTTWPGGRSQMYDSQRPANAADPAITGLAMKSVRTLPHACLAIITGMARQPNVNSMPVERTPSPTQVPQKTAIPRFHQLTRMLIAEAMTGSASSSTRERPASSKTDT
ncbi:MAG: sulfatase-like hydrolase/transferase, partial [Planctomycetota bacterium]